MPSETLEKKDLGAVLAHIRPSVRGEKPYLVGHPPDVTVKLNQNESPFDLPAELKDELKQAVDRLPFNRYPSEQPYTLIEKLSEHTGHDADGLLVGNGSNELTYMMGLALIEAGTPVVLPRPMFSLYEKVVHLGGGDLVGVPPRADLSFDAEALLEAVAAHAPALVVLTSPNNPTGHAMPLAEIEALAEAAPGFVVVDEAYVEFGEEPSAQVLLGAYPNIIVLRTLSKAFGLAGVRLGYLLAHPAVTRELMKARLPFMVGRFAERLGLALLERPGLLEERVRLLKEGRRAMQRAVSAMDGVETVPSQANFFLFKTRLDTDRLMKRLTADGVLVRDMSGYPELCGYLRVSAGTPEENKAFLVALEKALYAERPT